MSREPFLPVLTEIICAIDKNLIVQRLGSEVFLYKSDKQKIGKMNCSRGKKKNALEG